MSERESYEDWDEMEKEEKETEKEEDESDAAEPGKYEPEAVVGKQPRPLRRKRKQKTKGTRGK
jgi:hypothetical protein